MDNHPYHRPRSGAAPESVRPYPAPRPDEAERSVYCVMSTLTTTLHKKLAVNEHAAFGEWIASHDIEGQVLCGQRVDVPFRRLEIGLETSGTLHEVYVVAEPVLEKGQILLDLTDLGGEIND